LLRTFTIFSLVVHIASVVVCIVEFESVWIGLLLVALAGKVILVCWMILVGWRRQLIEPSREVERWQQLQELYALMAIMCLLNGGTISSMGAVELQQPEVEVRRVLVPFFLALCETVCCIIAFQGRRSAGQASVWQIQTSQVDAENDQKQFAAEIQFHFLLHLTNYLYDADRGMILHGQMTLPGQLDEEVRSTSGASNQATTCAICLDSFSDGEEVSQPLCTHFFHKSCLEGWVETLSHKVAQQRTILKEQVLCPLRCDRAKVRLLTAVTPQSSVTPGSRQMSEAP